MSDEPLFIEQLDGITAETPEEAREQADQEAEYRAEREAESGWLRAAEHNHFTPEEGGY